MGHEPSAARTTEAGTNQPQGKAYNMAFGEWLQRYKLDDMDKGDRSRLFSVMDNLPNVEEWRRTLPLTTRLKLNHPNAVWRKFHAAYEPEKPKGDKPTLRDSVASLSEEVAAKDREIASLQEHVAELMAAHDVEDAGHTGREPVEGPPATLVSAIDAVLALIDDPIQWPATVKSERARKALHTALIAAHDAIAAGAPAPKSRRPRKTSSTELSP
jgi:hypothetical protein